ncbi:Prophage integrase IntA [Methylobacterium adhaesivum]|uniref:Tyrosine-type recombinase/integrase n=1 Tax=Methylobacterium adhaesivum TaxID=333297 RepID=A0ABT8BME3_9HYPH|nr:site-specific integrase [Methylobacterium adhaesivum]MDN3592476.1 tyrosine-type recombinase/integrase [Methylobacterium adhaesivum]GJD32819.1 Prophage integrase IntA [Methylobacterium adhaesivum]
MPRRATSDNLVRLTKTLIPTLKIGEGQTERVVWDTETHGLGLRLRRSGNAAWVVRPPRKGGASRIFTLGSVTVLSLTDARKAAADRMASATLGVDHHAERAAAKARAAVTFGSELPRYLARAESRLRASSFRDVRRYLDVQAQPLHGLPLADIRRAHVAALLGSIAETSGPFASNRARAALSAFFTWMVGEGLTETNAVIGTNKATAETARDRVLNDTELAAVWRATAEPRDFDRIVRLLILLGQRRQEVAAMRWSELDLQGAVWRLPAERTKNKRPHDVPLSAVALEILAGVPEREGRDLLFGERKGPFSGFTKGRMGIEERSGVTDWRIHDLRRSSATGMAGIGVLPHVVEAVLNHASGAKTGVAGIYNRASYATEKRAALDAWAVYVLKLAGTG